MTPAEFATHVRFMTRTNSTTFTDASILALMKIRQDEIAKAILKADEDILLIPQYANLVADQREYPLPSDILSKIKRVEAKLDETNWLVLDEFDMPVHRKPISSETEITYNFSNEEGNCFFDILRKAIKIYSGTITDVTDGLGVWCNTWPTAITDLTSTTAMEVDPSTTTHGIPREMHEIWARGVIIDFKGSRDKPIPLTEKELKYEFDKEATIESLRNANLDREVIARLPSASSRGNDGSDY